MVKQVCQLLVNDPFGWQDDPNGTIRHPRTGIRLARSLNGRWAVGAVRVGFFSSIRLTRAYLKMYDARAQICMDDIVNREYEMAVADERKQLVEAQ